MIRNNLLRTPQILKRLLNTTTHNLTSERTSEEPKKCPKGSQRRQERVLVVGAGIAGLSAAVQLIKDGFDVTVLEATNRPGGRVYSCCLGETVAELGAEWLTGATLSNPLVPLVSQEGLLFESYEYNYNIGPYVTSDGRLVDPTISTQAYITFKQLVNQAYELKNSGEKQLEAHGSLMEFIDFRMKQLLESFPNKQRADAQCVMYGLTNKICNRWGTQLDNISADFFGNFVPMIGESIGLQKGLSSIITAIMKQLPCGTIKYSKEVVAIQWDKLPHSGTRVIVATSDKSKYPTDYVIVTVSLGVLKNERISFVPDLSEEKMTAILSIGFGNICKLFIEYERPFWMPRQGPIKFAWTRDEISNKDSWIKGLHCLEELPGSRRVLMGTVSGDAANELEKLSDVTVASNITDFLRGVTQDSTLPYPDCILRSQWKTNPYFDGAVTFMNKCSTAEVLHKLMEPVAIPFDKCETPRRHKSELIPKIFFAGEAMIEKYFSTVHGARLSGLKIAGEVLKASKEMKKYIPCEEICEDFDACEADQQRA